MLEREDEIAGRTRQEVFSLSKTSEVTRPLSYLCKNPTKAISSGFKLYFSVITFRKLRNKIVKSSINIFFLIMLN